jgi:glycerophosphoryl diester phosphodiesterase
LWPENTLVAFEGAVNHGCKYIETDLQITKDGVIVVFHDKYLNRVTNGRGRVKDWTWGELKKLDAAYNFGPDEDYPFREKGIKILSLEEVMKTFPQVMFNLDLKQSHMERPLSEFIIKNRFQDRVLIASFNDNRIQKFRKIFGNMVATSTGTWETKLIWALSRFKGTYHTSAKAIQVPHRRGRLTVVDQRLIMAAHTQNVQVHTWTVNDPRDMHRLLKLGVDGLVTDRIDLLNHVLLEYKNQK